MNVTDILHMLLDGTISVEEAIQDIKVLQNAETPTANEKKDSVLSLETKIKNIIENGGGGSAAQNIMVLIQSEIKSAIDGVFQL